MDLKPTFEFETIRVNYKKDTLPLDIPKATLKAGDNSFILFLQNLYLTIVKEQRDTSDPAKHYSVTPTPGNEAAINKMKMFNYYFHFKLNYFIYDNTGIQLYLTEEWKRKTVMNYLKILN